MYYAHIILSTVSALGRGEKPERKTTHTQHAPISTARRNRGISEQANPTSVPIRSSASRFALRDADPRLFPGKPTHKEHKHLQSAAGLRLPFPTKKGATSLTTKRRAPILRLFRPDLPYPQPPTPLPPSPLYTVQGEPPLPAAAAFSLPLFHPRRRLPHLLATARSRNDSYLGGATADESGLALLSPWRGGAGASQTRGQQEPGKGGKVALPLLLLRRRWRRLRGRVGKRGKGRSLRCPWPARGGNEGEGRLSGASPGDCERLDCRPSGCFSSVPRGWGERAPRILVWEVSIQPGAGLRNSFPGLAAAI